jgi:hypothetical protein
VKKLCLTSGVSQVLTAVAEEYNAPPVGGRQQCAAKLQACFKIGEIAIDHRVELLECTNRGWRLFDQGAPPHRHQRGQVAGRANVERTVNELHNVRPSRRRASRQVTDEGYSLFGPWLDKRRARASQQKQAKYQKPHAQ